jgi:NAD(P)-dependent dehydrogenase (short-subunit alcohol dehydrogenase family)
VIVTGAGRGIGREEALEFARQGAKVVVADIGVELDGQGGSSSVAQGVVDEIKAMGGEAVASDADVGDWVSSKQLIDQAIETFGGLDTLVNNAGILRDKMIFNMTEDDFDSVVRVHLKGTFNTVHWASVYWRGRSKEELENDARIVNTSSPSGLYGNMGQANYSSCKAGIAAMTMLTAAELGRYGVNVNCISPAATTRMTNSIPGREYQRSESTDDQWDPGDPANIAPTVVWLGSSASKDVTGRVFEVRGGSVAVAEPWHTGPKAEKEGRWDPNELTDVIPGLVSEARPLRILERAAARAAGQAVTGQG